MNKLLFLLSSLCALNASVLDHLKSIPSDKKCQSIPGIDFIYVINLDERPEKYEWTLRQLAPYGIVPYRFSAVNGWKLSLETINALGVKFGRGMPKDLWGTHYSESYSASHEIMHVPGRTYFCHCMSRGAIGICLSQLSILKDAYDAGYERIWVMEDDIQVLEEPRVLSYLIEKLDAAVGQQGWDILFTDKDTKNTKNEHVPCSAFARRPNFTPLRPARSAERKKVGKDFIKIGARYGAYSMIINRSGMKKLLDFFVKYNLFLPYDMEYVFPNKINLFSLQRDVVSHWPQAASDNGGENYKK